MCRRLHPRGAETQSVHGRLPLGHRPSRGNGKFDRLAEAGFHVEVPFIEKVAGTVNLRVQQLDVEVETKTRDNVFVRVIVSVQYYVLADKL